ncbi:MAG: alcohol dehydrogenase catalytic domain-containing protein [Clostridiales Family XIII bacterium]|jgi:L-iditol 2-dehydrogenase|nr:alcohol dehydrogenase catalytic domain-containing protein [Clostridiales Family XIII bacterium]
MAETMKAYVYESANRAALRDVPHPKTDDDEALIRVRAVGICHTDLMVLSGVNIVPVPFPFIGGHEWTGEIVRVGAKVKAFKPGDRVVGEGNSGCGSCKICRDGYADYCAVEPVQRGINTDGSFAEYYKLPARLLHKIPDSMDWITASMIEPFSVAYNGIHAVGGCDAGDTVFIAGGGSIGLCAAVAAKAMGARVMLSEPQARRRAVAKAFGVDCAFDPTTEDIVQGVKSLTGDFGADLVIEASGNADSMKQALDIARNNGRVSYIGVNVGEAIPVEIGKIQMRGLLVRGMLGSPAVWGRVVDFLGQSKPDIARLSTHRFPLTEIDKAFALARNIKDSEAIKITVIM